MVALKKVVSDEVYDSIHGFITTNNILIDDYDSMVETVLKMIQGGYCFTMDRDTLRDAMECLTYMYCPSDDMNRDRVMQQLVDEEDDEESDESDEEPMGSMDLMKLMQVMGAPPAKMTTDETDGSTCPDDKTVVTDVTETTCAENESTVVKQE